jgi:GDP-4-dehydro-6-deoxy-D-mannose reductase
MKTKYLITGYSGFVSRHFLNLLESMQEPVIVLGVDITEPEESVLYSFVECSFIKVNLLNKEAVHDVLINFKPDFLLHLASYSSVAFSWENPVDAFVNNSNIFLNLIDQVRLLRLKCRILSVGSSEEYGNVAKEQLPLSEELPVKPTSPYAVARVSQEMLSEIYAQSYGIDIVLTRSFNHIGPGQKDIFVISSFAKKLANIKKSGAKEAKMTVGNIFLTRDFVDVRDVVKAYYLLFNKGKRGEVYNICSGTGSSLNDIVNEMARILDLTIETEVDDKLIRPGENQIIIGSNKKIALQTGWQPSIPLNVSLKEIIEYWMNK